MFNPFLFFTWGKVHDGVSYLVYAWMILLHVLFSSILFVQQQMSLAGALTDFLKLICLKSYIIYEATMSNYFLHQIHESIVYSAINEI